MTEAPVALIMNDDLLQREGKVDVVTGRRPQPVAERRRYVFFRIERKIGTLEIVQMIAHGKNTSRGSR